MFFYVISIFNIIIIVIILITIHIYTYNNNNIIVVIMLMLLIDNFLNDIYGLLLDMMNVFEYHWEHLFHNIMQNNLKFRILSSFKIID